MVQATEDALVVLSGGQDSTACLGLAVANHVTVRAVTFNYGQRHVREVDAARDIAEFFNVELETVSLGSHPLQSTSPLVDHSAELEQYVNYEQMDQIIGDRVEATFVPMRNALFLTLAANRAACTGTKHIYTGVCQADGANYPDCRAEFISSMSTTVNMALGNDEDSFAAQMKIVTPLIYLTKAESIRLARGIPGVFQAWAMSHTSYDGAYPPTGHDHATVLRAKGFELAVFPDPLIVRAWLEGLMDLPETANYQIVKESEISSILELCQVIEAKLLITGQPNVQ